MILAPHPTTFSLNLARSHIVSHHTTVQPCVPNWQSFGVLIIAFLKPSLLLHPHHRCQSLPPVCLQTSRSLARSSPAAAEISLWTVGQPQISVWWVDLAKQNRGMFLNILVQVLDYAQATSHKYDSYWKPCIPLWELKKGHEKHIFYVWNSTNKTHNHGEWLNKGDEWTR